jgi:hypothetical protein
MKQRRRRTKDELQGASNHLRYEIDMLLGTARGLATGISGRSIIHNALLESFTVHTRAVLGFLYAYDPQDDDVIAEDFFADTETWVNNRPEKTELLAQVHKRVGKEIAHLTYVRQQMSEEEKKWAFTDIAGQLEKILELFLSLVSRELLGTRWQDHLAPNELKPKSNTSDL